MEEIKDALSKIKSYQDLINAEIKIIEQFINNNMKKKEEIPIKEKILEWYPTKLYGKITTKTNKYVFSFDRP